MPAALLRRERRLSVNQKKDREILVTLSTQNAASHSL